MRAGRDPLAPRTHGYASVGDRRLSARRLVALLVALVVVVGVGAAALVHRPTSTPVVGSAAAPTAAASTPAAPSTGAPSTGAPSTPVPSASSSASSPPGRSLSGKALAAAWLTGYLDRTSRDDEQWVETIRDSTDPDLLAQLKSNGPDAVGLFELASWRVTDVAAFDDPDQPLDTPSRQVLAYSVAVTDGQQTEHKPFLLYCYRSTDGRWTVSVVEQPYTSEG